MTRKALVVVTILLGSVVLPDAASAAACSVLGGDFDSNGTNDIRVVGNAQNNTVTISDNAATDVATVSVDCNGDGDTSDGSDSVTIVPSEPETFDITLRDGRDRIVFATTGSLYSGDARSLLFDLGPGKNALDLDALGLDDASNMSLDVRGGSGNDAIDITFANVKDSVLTANLLLGGGADVLLNPDGSVLGPSQFTVANDNGDIENATVTLDADLGSGSNRFRVGVEGDLNLGDLPVTTVVNTSITGSPGSKDKDDVTFEVPSVTLQTESVLTLDVDLLGGNDTFLETLPSGGFDLLKRSWFLQNINGGAGRDTIEVVRTETGNVDLDGLLQLIIAGGTGNDVIDADLGDAVRQFDSAETTPARGLKLRTLGGDGNDDVNVSLGNTTGATFDYDVASHGNAGADTMNLEIVEPGGTPTYGPAGALLQDGGSGTDVCTSSVGSEPFVERNCP